MRDELVTYKMMILKVNKLQVKEKRKLNKWMSIKK